MFRRALLRLPSRSASLVARQFDTIGTQSILLRSTAIPLAEYRTYTRNLDVDAALVQLKTLEKEANRSPQDPFSQEKYLRALNDSGVYHEVLRRYRSGYYANNSRTRVEFERALHSMRGGDGRVDMEYGLHDREAVGGFGGRERAGGYDSHYGDRGDSSAGYNPESPLYVAKVEQKNPFEFLLRLLQLGISGFLVYMIYQAFNSESSSSSSGLFGSFTRDDNEPVVLALQNKVRFSDVRGVNEAKEELESVVDFLKNPAKYEHLGARIPRGVLLTGPPGTGKTLLARAVAGEAGVDFYNKSAAEFDEMLVGLGARRVRTLFEKARKSKNGAIIFIDEIDAVGGKRARVASGSGAERQTLNQLLASMDGFEPRDRVIVIAATNEPQLLDSALVRPGRFDTKVQVALPDIKGRKEILELYLSKIVASSEIDPEVFARATPGFSGAELMTMVNEASMLAARRGASQVELQDMEEARDKIIMGPASKSKVVSKETMELTAYHEGGHTLAAILTPNAEKLHKVTILPRGFSGGATYFLMNKKESGMMSRKQMLAELDVCMGGRAAEELIYGKDSVTTGAGQDLQQATKLARNYVMRYAMSDLGLAAYDENASEETKALIDRQVEELLQTSYQRVVDLLKTNKKKLERLAKALLEFETLTEAEVEDVIAGKKLNWETKKGQSKKYTNAGKKDSPLPKIPPLKTPNKPPQVLPPKNQPPLDVSAGRRGEWN